MATIEYKSLTPPAPYNIPELSNVYILGRDLNDGNAKTVRLYDYVACNEVLGNPSRFEIVGVGFIEENKIYVVSLDEANLPLATTSAQYLPYVTTLEAALATRDGKASTATLMTRAECNKQGYAAYYCTNYSTSTGPYFKAGNWWLPSFGELMLMRKYARPLNYLLSLIPNAKQIAMSANYHTSTQYNLWSDWNTWFNTTSIYPGNTTYANRVRPMTIMSFNTDKGSY